MALKKKPNGYWTEEKIQVEALIYKNPSSFQNNSKGAYLSALRKGILKKVCSHMNIKTYWTNEMLEKEGLIYKSRRDFRKKSPTAYQLSFERGILDRVCSHMNYLIKCWDNKSIQEESIKYNSKTEFRLKSSGAYNAATKKGILDEVCSHMVPIRTYWTDEMLKNEALKYNTRGEFQNNSESAYILSINRGILDEICSDMKILSGFSIGEKEVLSFVKNFYSDSIGNTKKIVPPLELDIFIPSLNLGIEYCGLYWHSEEMKDNDYHFKKMKLCNEKGIRLITIFEDEWLTKKEQVCGYLKSVLNKNEIKYFARKMDLKIVDKKEAKNFLDTYHIQGSVRFEVAFGLYSGQELVAIMTGGKHHRQGHNSTFVLNRLAFKFNVSVSGGASRLLKALLDYAKSNNFTKLVSWSDNRYSEGRVYESIGFSLDDVLGPDYSYVLGQTRISKQSCKKSELLKKGASGTMENSEKELALSLGLYRIWDCGKKAWSIGLK